MTSPLVSVVLSVYNAARFLRPSLESILRQEAVDCEFILVDDGSTDGSAAILAEAAHANPRIRLLRQPNRGLTQALIRGCAEARGVFIARQDADDLSLPGRLARQVEMLQADARLALASCWTRTVGPEDELLFETRQPLAPEEATRELKAGIRGPNHGSVTFRADAYRSVGGYREAFRFTQDWDLWLRLADVGLIGYVPEVLFAFRVSDASISAQRASQQSRLQQIALRCREARTRGQSEQPWLDEAVRVCAEPRPASTRAASANAYFIGKCLLDRRDRRALTYLRRCIANTPWSWRSWAAFTAAVLLCHRTPA